MYYAQKVYAVGVTHCKIIFFKMRVDTGSLSKICHYWTKMSWRATFKQKEQ